MIWAQVLIVAWLMTLIGMHSRVVALLLALLILVPFHEGVSMAMALRGLWGDPSITTLQLLVLALAGRAPAALRHGYRVPAIIAAFALALYASALGPFNLDVYRFGYQPAALVGVFAIIALAAWWRGQALYLWLLAIDLFAWQAFAWQAGWLESTNLWDTVLDPLLMLAMLALTVRNGYRAHRNRKTLLA